MESGVVGQFQGLWVVIVVNLERPPGTKHLCLCADSHLDFYRNGTESFTTAAFVGRTVLLLYKIIALWQMLSFPRIVSLRLMRGNGGSSINTSGLD